MTWTAKPDAYFAGLKKVDALIGQGLLTDHAVPYATNTLTIMVPKGNPAHVDRSGRSRKPMSVSPCPTRIRGIARQIEASLKKAGGQALADAVYKTKVPTAAQSSPISTIVRHHVF